MDQDKTIQTVSLSTHVTVVGILLAAVIATTTWAISASLIPGLVASQIEERLDKHIAANNLAHEQASEFLQLQIDETKTRLALLEAEWHKHLEGLRLPH